MAGLVVKVLVENGAFVEENQPVLVLEAMKMEVKTTSLIISTFRLLNHILLVCLLSFSMLLNLLVLAM